MTGAHHRTPEPGVASDGIRRERRRRVVVAVLAVWAVALALSYWSATDRPRIVSLTVLGGALQVSLADTSELRAAGLSNREAVPHDGMLLQWDTPGRHPIWMSEMRFALDIVWLDADGRVVSVLADVPPCTAAPCPLYGPAGSEESTAVLELAAGKAATYGLTVGAVVGRQ